MDLSAQDLDIDWDENFVLPVANAENKLLQESVLKRTNEKNTYGSQLTENQSKVNALREHIKLVKDELISAQVKFATNNKKE